MASSSTSSSASPSPAFPQRPVAADADHGASSTGGRPTMPADRHHPGHYTHGRAHPVTSIRLPARYYDDDQVIVDAGS
jgi:hypothetical protein